MIIAILLLVSIITITVVVSVIKANDKKKPKNKYDN